MRDKIAIFDLDGTLYDTRKVNFLAYQQALHSCGADIDYEYFSRYCNGRRYTDFLPEILKSVEEVERVHQLKKESYASFLSNAVENTGLFSVLNTLRPSYYIALVTTASKKNAMEILAKFNRENCFDLILTQEDVKKAKPDPEGFLLAMKKFGIEANHTIIFEDSDVGLQAAIATGATVFAAKGFA